MKTDESSSGEQILGSRNLLSLTRVNLVVYEKQNKRSGTRWVDYRSTLSSLHGSLWEMPRCAVLWIKEQSRPTLTRNNISSKQEGSSHSKSAAAATHCCEKKRLPGTFHSGSLSLGLGEKHGAAGRKAIFLFLPLRCERKIAQRELCVYLLHPLTRSTLSAWWNQRICPGCHCQNCSRLPLGWFGGWMEAVERAGLVPVFGCRGCCVRKTKTHQNFHFKG